MNYKIGKRCEISHVCPPDEYYEYCNTLGGMQGILLDFGNEYYVDEDGTKTENDIISADIKLDERYREEFEKWVDKNWNDGVISFWSVEITMLRE